MTQPIFISHSQQLRTPRALQPALVNGQVFTFVDVSRIGQKGGQEPGVFSPQEDFYGRQIPEPKIPIRMQVLARLPPLSTHWRPLLLPGASRH